MLFLIIYYIMFWHCWLGIRKSTQPVKIEWCDEVLVWLPVCSKVQIVCTWSSWCHCIPKLHRLLPHSNPHRFYLSGTGSPRLYSKIGHETGVSVVTYVPGSSCDAKILTKLLAGSALTDADPTSYNFLHIICSFTLHLCIIKICTKQPCSCN